jgi:hypothetical protein
MAKIQFGAVATDARGKIAGIVYSKNKAGGYVRAKVSPSQTESERRTFVRSLFSVNSQEWSTGLTIAQVNAWNEFARAHLVTDVFGQAHALSGAQMYQRLNSVIAQAGGTVIDDPPDDLSITALLTMTPTITAGAPDVVSIAFTPTPPEASHKIAVYATKPLNAGRTFAKGDKRFLFLSAAAAASPAVCSAAYLAKFGALTAGKKVGIWIQKINVLTGAQTLPLYKLVTVA